MTIPTSSATWLCAASSLDRSVDCWRRSPTWILLLPMSSRTLNTPALKVSHNSLPLLSAYLHSVDALISVSARERGDQLNSSEFETIETSLFTITALLVAREEQSSTSYKTVCLDNTDCTTDSDPDMCSCLAQSPDLQPKRAFVMQGAMVRKLLQQLCRAPIKIFTPMMVELAATCWYWLLAARPNLKLQVSPFTWNPFILAHTY